MDVLTAIHTRRSVRAFTPEVVSEKDRAALLEAAMSAPSAGNAQPWTFVVVDGPELLRRVPELNPYAGMAPQAPLAVLVSGDLSREKFPGYWVQDCSAAIQNMLLAAVGLGLGAVWTGIYPLEDRVTGFRALFGLPETMVPLGLIVIGHPKTEQTPKNRFDAAKVRHNRWTS